MRPTRCIPLVLFASVVAAPLSAQDFDFEAAAAYSSEHAGLAVLVYQDGERLFEQYQNGHEQDDPQHIFSGTKSFAPIVALIAQDEGLLSLDEKVVDTITEWKGDARREKVTVRHLLDFTSGLEQIDSLLHSRRTPDKYSKAVDCKCKHEPGKRFRYGSNHLMVFGELFSRKLRAASTEEKPLPEDFVAYLEERVLDPIGCEYSRWIRDRAGNPLLPYGAFMTAREWAKFGMLIENRGKWGDKQIVPTKHFDECFEGSKANPVYGLNFWLFGEQLHRRDELIPEDTVVAAGMYKQKLYIIPSRDLVVVRLGKSGVRAPYQDLEFLGRLFAKKPAAKPADGKAGQTGN